MEVDIQAEFSEGQALPNQAAMGPLVAQIMRAVTGQAAPPARQAQQASWALLSLFDSCSAPRGAWGMIPLLITRKGAAMCSRDLSGQAAQTDVQLLGMGRALR